MKQKKKVSLAVVLAILFTIISIPYKANADTIVLSNEVNLNYASDIKADSQNNLYLMDYSNSMEFTVKKFNTSTKGFSNVYSYSGVNSYNLGDIPATIDGQGNYYSLIYENDSQNGETAYIKKISSDGQLVSSRKVDIFTDFMMISENDKIAVDNSDNVYIIDQSKVEKFDSVGNKTNIDLGNQFYTRAIVNDKSGNVFAFGGGNNGNEIKKIASDGQISSYAQNIQFTYNGGITVDNSGNVYLTSYISGSNYHIDIIAVNSNGQVSTVESLDHNQFVYRITADNQGNIYGLSQSGRSILKFHSGVEIAPTISNGLEDKEVLEGDGINLSVAASGDNLNYQWLKDGNIINGATQSTYNIPNAQLSDAGTYTVKVSNSTGNEESTAEIKVKKLVTYYTVSFDAAGGSDVENQQVAADDKAVKPSDSIRSGYTFGGWYRDSSFTTAFNFENDTITNDIILYAKWNTIIIVSPPSTDTTKPNLPSTNVRQADIEVGNGTQTSSKVDITRKEENNKKIDSVALNETNISDVLKEASDRKQNKISIVVTDIPNDKADKNVFNIDKSSVGKLSGSKVALELQTDNVDIELPKESIDGLAKNGNDLFFQIVPVRNEENKQTAIDNAVKSDIVKSVAGNNEVKIYGLPMTIETNYKDLNTKVTFSLKDLNIPQEASERKIFLSNLAVFIQHNDSEKVLDRGTIMYDSNGNPTGIQIQVTKFSTFTILGVKNASPKAARVTLRGKTKVGEKLTVSYSYSDFDKDQEGSSLYRWYRADDINGKNKKLIFVANKLTYTVTKQDQGKYIIFEVTPIAKNGTNEKKVFSVTSKTAVQKIQYNTHFKLGLIGNKTYADRLTKIIRSVYGGQNATVKKQGKYYRVSADFINKAAAQRAGVKMRYDKLIIDYSIN